MAPVLTKETCVQKYQECKISKNGRIPEYAEFLKYADISKAKLARVFGASAYTKLQIAAGDTANKLQLERTPIETIMQQYGRLVTELGALPPYAEWDHRGMRPTETGLRKIHGIKWSEFPNRFVEWVETNTISGLETAVEIITSSVRPDVFARENGDTAFLRLIRDVITWTPARRRSSEGEYKIELRKHLESLKHELNEEFGESKYDLLVQGAYVIEIKKDPDLGEYDRLFGQVARHLQHCCKVIVLILEPTRSDKYDNFVLLVDKHLNNGQSSVEVIKK